MAEKNRTERLIEAVEDLAKHTRESLREQFAGIDIGMETVSDAEFLTWFAMKTGALPADGGIVPSPPEPFLHPDMPVRMIPWQGQLVQASFVMSPWELALHYVEGGKEMLDRRDRAMSKAMGVE